MLGTNDLNDYSGTNHPSDVVVAQSTGGFEASKHGPIFRTDGESSSNILIPVPSTLTDWPVTLLVMGTVTTLSGLDMYVSLAWDGESDESFGMRFSAGELQGFVYTTDINIISQGEVTVAVGDDVICAWVCVSATERRLYLNGEQVAIDIDSDAFPAGSGSFNLGIGTLPRSSPGYDPGLFSCVRLYNRALTASEIKEITDDPWADYKRDDNELWAGSALGGSDFKAAYACHSNQIL
jgi:hypothetical protein